MSTSYSSSSTRSAPPATWSPSATCTARTVPRRARRPASPSSSPRGRGASAACATLSPGGRHLDHRARHRRGERALLAARGARACARSRRRPAAVRRRSRQVEAPCPAPRPVGSRAGGAESGGYSARNAVVVPPARTPGGRRASAGTAGSSSTPLDLGLGERVARVGRAPRRGSRRARSASRSSGRRRPRPRRPPRRRRRRGSPSGRRSRSMRPACGRNVRGSSA